jgi:hypothetical protein
MKRMWTILMEMAMLRKRLDGGMSWLLTIAGEKTTIATNDINFSGVGMMMITAEPQRRGWAAPIGQRFVMTEVVVVSRLIRLLILDVKPLIFIIGGAAQPVTG